LYIEIINLLGVKPVSSVILPLTFDVIVVSYAYPAVADDRCLETALPAIPSSMASGHEASN